jgi:hypothetical protein
LYDFHIYKRVRHNINDMRINSFIELITYFESVKSRNNLVFRGQGDKDWKLIPKSGRPEYWNNYSNSASEKGIFEAWVRYSKSFIEKVSNNLWDYLAIAQHFGLATRLLDWSKNPLIASYFACSEATNKDAALYSLKILEVNNPTIVDPFDISGFKVFYPSGLSNRIVSQRGVFTISGKPNIPIDKGSDFEIKKIEINKDAKMDILDSLNFLNINELSILQDITSLSTFLNNFILKQAKNKSLLDLGMLPGETDN